MITQDKLADILQITKKTLYRWRNPVGEMRANPLPFHRDQKSAGVLYKISDVRTWLERNNDRYLDEFNRKTEGFTDATN